MIFQDTFSSTEFIDQSHDEPSSGGTFQSTEPPNGIMRESGIDPSKCHLELRNLGPIVPEFPPPPSEDIADRLQEGFKGKRRKYWNILHRDNETKMKIP